MRKSLLTAVIALVMVIGLNSCGNNIDTVKKGVLPKHKSLTINQAFENWSNCKSSNWSEYKKSNGMEIVEFSCQQKGVSDYFLQLKKSLSSTGKAKKDFLDIQSSIIKYQFVINIDNTFDLLSIEEVFTWEDNLSASIITKELFILENKTKLIFDDKLNYDINLNNISFDSVKMLIKKREAAIYTGYLKSPTEKMQVALITINLEYIKKIYNPSETVQLTVAKADPSLIEYIKNPSVAVQKIASSYQLIELTKSIRKGQALYENNGCAGCHSIDTDDILVGPSLKGIGAKHNTTYLKDAIVTPDKDVPEGFFPIMPPFTLSDTDVENLVKYIQNTK